MNDEVIEMRKEIYLFSPPFLHQYSCNKLRWKLKCVQSGVPVFSKYVFAILYHRFYVYLLRTYCTKPWFHTKCCNEIWELEANILQHSIWMDKMNNIFPRSVLFVKNTSWARTSFYKLWYLPEVSFYCLMSLTYLEYESQCSAFSIFVKIILSSLV